jgi:hypothetical protein
MLLPLLPELTSGPVVLAAGSVACPSGWSAPPYASAAPAAPQLLLATTRRERSMELISGQRSTVVDKTAMAPL